MKNQFRTTALALSLLTATGATAATSGSHYPIGGEGVMAGTPPPPGIHYRLYNTWYNADKITDNHGDNSGLDVEIDAFVQLHRLVHVTDKKLFGANWAYNVIVPLVHEEFSSGALGIDHKTSFALGDVVLEPLALFWYGEEFDAALGLAVIAPTGDYDAHDAASPGMGFWSGMLTLGGTYYMGEDRSWSASILTRTIYNGNQDDTNVRPGAEFAVEGGIGKQFPLNDQWLARPGISYGASWQISDDSKDAPGVVADHHKESYCIGAELNLMYLPWHLQANLRYATEFGAKNTAEGESVVLTLTKSF